MGISYFLRPCLLALLATVLSVSTTPASAAEWLTEFKVVHESPFVLDLWQQEMEEPVKELISDIRKRLTGDDVQEKKRLIDQAWGRVMEGYLSNIAKRYKAAGLLPPVNMPVIEQDGKKKYVVYLYDFREAVTSVVPIGSPATLHEAAGFASFYVCKGNPFTFLAIDKAKLPYAQKLLKQKLYVVLAHELFHTVQYTYDIKYGSIQMCSTGGDNYSNEMVVEGMADAAAVYVTNQRWPEFLRQTESPKLVGLYRYLDPFLQKAPNPNADLDYPRSPYRTNSFWRNLAERFGELAFLDHLLKQPVAKNPSSDEVLVWLERGLKSWPRFGWGMYTMFPAFLTEFTASAGVRYRSWDEDRLLSEVFNECATKELTPAEPVKSLYYPTINKVAGNCFIVRWKGFPGQIELHVDAHGQSLSLLDHVHLGVARARTTNLSGQDTDFNCYKSLSKLGRYNNPLASCEFEKTFIQTGPAPGMYVKRWQADPKKFNGVQGEILFVLTNVALVPKKTFTINGPNKKDVEFWVGIKYTKSESSQRPMKPAETQQLRVPGMGKADETAYGINKAKPVKMGSNLPVFNLEVPQGENDGEDVPPAAKYGVLPLDKQPIVSGYKGPLYGMVAAEYSDKYQNRPVTSMLCKNANKGRIGQVLRADAEIMVVHVKSDLCLMPNRPNQQPKVVDRLDATITLPFGWRYFAKTAPIDIVTPGTRYYMKRYQQRLAGMGLPGMGSGQGPEGSPPGLSGPSSGTGSFGNFGSSGGGAGVSKSTCQCSCDEYEKMQALGEAGVPEAVMVYAPCIMQCMNAYERCASEKPD